MTTPPVDLWRCSAVDLLSGYASGRCSPVEVVDEALARLARLNPVLHAFLAIDEQGARRAAREAELAWQAARSGTAIAPPLCGVPISVKDTIEMAGLPTTYGSLVFKDNLQQDSEIVTRLRQAGAVLLGKTNTPEFALLGAVRNRLGPDGRNPWDLSRTPGGSSGGGAAAVASGIGPLAIGTDSGGSIRQPAAFTGLVGFKPTYQRIPTVQRWRAAPGRSHNGPLARTVTDVAVLMNVLGRPDARDPSSALAAVSNYAAWAKQPPSGARIGLSRDFGGRVSGVDPRRVAAVDETGDLLRSAGYLIIEADPPPPPTDELEPGVWAYSGDHYAAAQSLVPNFWDTHADTLTDYARPIYEAGRRALAWQYRQMLGRNQRYVAEMQAWFEDNDLRFLVAPAVLGPPPLLQRTAERDAKALGFLRPFNTAQSPAIVVPPGFDVDGLPVVVQIAGRFGDDVGVLGVAAWLEQVRPWRDAWPALSQVVC